MPSPMKREDERVGHKRQSYEATPKADKLEPTAVTIPEAREEWPDVAAYMYAALQESPQSVYFTSADWSYAFFTMDAVAHCVASGYSAMKLSSVEAMLRDLMMTEPQRRKARIEIQRVVDNSDAERAKVAQMNEYRKAAYG